MTNAERRERRREAARKGAAKRAARVAPAARDQADEFQALADRINGYEGATPPEAPQPPRIESAEDKARKADDREANRLENLRAVLRRAQGIRRESDLARE